MNSPPLSCLPDESVPSIIAKSINNSCDDIGEDSRDHHGINSVTGEITSTRAHPQQSNPGVSLVNSPRRNLQVLAVLEEKIEDEEAHIDQRRTNGVV